MLQSFNLFGHDCIGVKMESDGIETYQQQSRLAVGADVNVGGRTRINLPEIAQRDSRLMAFSWNDHPLHSQEHVPRTPVNPGFNMRVNKGLGLH